MMNVWHFVYKKRRWRQWLLAGVCLFLVLDVFASELSDALGWVAGSCAENLCCGHYQNHPIMLRTDPVPAMGHAGVRVQANQVLVQPKGKPSELSGDVRVEQPGRLLLADRAKIERDAVNGRVSKISLWGHLAAYLPGKLIKAEQGELDVLGQRSVFKELLYRLIGQTKHEQLNVWGKASRAAVSPDGVLTLDQATYGTCPPTHASWHLGARQVRLQPRHGFGEAFHTALYMGNVPFLYVPYLRFPLADQRMTGFLLPTVGYSSRYGWNIRLPFYWNLAENYDLTLTPQYLGKRGLLLTGDGRYLTAHSHGQVSAYWLLSDRLFTSFQDSASADFTDPLDAPGLSQLLGDDSHRVLVAAQHQSQWLPHWQVQANINLASDDYVFLDLGNPFNVVDSTRLLNRVQLDYVGEYSHFMARLQGHQTLHPLTQPVVMDLYSRLPELRWQLEALHGFGGADWGLDSSFVNFDHRSDFLTQQPVVEGSRMDVHPWVVFPVRSAGGFLMPKIGVQATDYHLRNLVPDEKQTIDRLLPIVSVDGGLFFDRVVRWGHQGDERGPRYRQTLEPRAFYLWIPKAHQDDIPLFDTTLLPFSFAHLFRENRFVGSDRVGDANQLSLGLTSRFLSAETGVEKWRLSMGQIVYFHRHTVCLQPDCANDPTRGNKISPLVAELSYHLTPALSGSGALAWDFDREQVNNGYIELHYRPDQRHVLYLGYDYVRDNDITLADLSLSGVGSLRRVHVGFIWPVTERWSALAYWHYNIDRGASESYCYGLSYEQCCWALRFLATHQLRGIEPGGKDLFETHYYVQFHLKGLTNLGNGNPMRLLAQRIGGI